jgi:hypothetical protein
VRSSTSTRDGWIHCRIAATGELAWRFRAAPDDPLKGPKWGASGLLYLLSRRDGEHVRTISLSVAPVHEGLLAVPSGLFACLKNGSVVRLAE